MQRDDRIVIPRIIRRAITVKAPYAQGFFDLGKPVENRPWPLYKDLLGEWVAIHVSASPSEWRAFGYTDCLPSTYCLSRNLPHTLACERYVAEHGGMIRSDARPPEAGLLIGVIRIVGELKVVSRDADDHDRIAEVDVRTVPTYVNACNAAAKSDWFTDDFGHVYANATRFKTPVAVPRGNLGYWFLSDEAQAAVTAQLEAA